MTCPFCGSPNFQTIGRNYFECLDCGEEFSGINYFLRLMISRNLSRVLIH